MEDNRTAAERTLQRRFERNRLEEQLWSMAYEHVWPVIRRSLKQAVEDGLRCQGSDTRENVARRA
jgi:hypothetical protein